MVPVQKIALKSLRRIFDKEWILSDALEKDERINMLSKADKDLLEQLVVETLRHAGELEKHLHKFVKEVDFHLLLGAAQILLFKHSNAEVSRGIMELAESEPQRKTYNAILNRIKDKPYEPDASLNFPNWMKGGWRKNYGEEKTKAIMEALLKDCHLIKPEFPEADELLEPPNSETGLMPIMPESLHQLAAEEVMEFVKQQNEALEETYQNLKKGQTVLYVNNSLQYEEGEGLVKKLNPLKWEVVEQVRILPCDSGSGGIGWFAAKLKRI